MTYTPIEPGTLDWDVPVNAAFTSQDARLTLVEAASTQNAERVDRLTFDVKTYGAVGDDSTNDRAAIQAAIDAAALAGGGTVFFPPGRYAVSALSGVCLSVPAKVNLVGAGRGASTIRKNSASSVLIDMSGPSTDDTGATHVRYGGIRDITLNGNSQSGSILRVYYADNLDFTRVFFTSGTEQLVDAVEFWDSRFYNCQFESSGGTNGATLPAVWLRNASDATPGNFGYSLDNCNQIVFQACRWENFHNGALRIEDGAVVGNNPNGIYVKNCKMETSQMQGGSHLFVDDSCLAIWVDSLYCFAGNFAGGFSTAQNIIDWSPARSSISNVQIANGAVAVVNSGVIAFSPANQRTVMRNIIGNYTTAPTGNHLFFSSSTGAWLVEDCYSGTGSTFGGTLPTAFEGNQPVKLVTAIPTDASFVRTPLNGTWAYRTDTGDLYIRSGAVWKQVIRTGTATLVAGTATVSTSAVTANTRIQLTGQADGSGTEGFLRVSTRIAGTSFTITSSDASDNSTVAWQMTEL